MYHNYSNIDLKCGKNVERMSHNLLHLWQLSSLFHAVFKCSVQPVFFKYNVGL